MGREIIHFKIILLNFPQAVILCCPPKFSIFCIGAALWFHKDDSEGEMSYLSHLMEKLSRTVLKVSLSCQSLPNLEERKVFLTSGNKWRFNTKSILWRDSSRFNTSEAQSMLGELWLSVSAYAPASQLRMIFPHTNRKHPYQDIAFN